MKPRYDNLRVDRLAECLARRDALYVDMTEEKLLTYPCIREFCEEHHRLDLDDAWHLGRVRFFVEQLRVGVKLEDRYRVDVAAVARVVDRDGIIDGHHR